MTPLKVCFISLNSYPLFKINHPGYFGGAELQISLLAKKLNLDHRIKISIVVGDYGQKPIETINRLTLYRAFRKQYKFSSEALRFFQLLKKINADIYIERTMNIKIGLVALWCRLFKKKFIYMTAHDWDTQKNLGGYLTGLAKFSFKVGLKLADLIIVQTQTQQTQLLDNFGIKSSIMRSLTVDQPIYSKVSRRWLLWIGRADLWKKPETFIKLAKSLPKQLCVMICREGNDKNYFNQNKTLAKKLPNLKFLSAVSHNKIMNYFNQAKCFVNTSIAEGFPNTFLQAGISKTPIISLIVNPDNFINKYNCGIWVNNSFSGLIKACKNLKRDFGNNNFRYVKKFHSQKNAQQLTKILLNNFGRAAKLT